MNLNVKDQAIKLLEEKKVENTQDLQLGKELLGLTPKTCFIKKNLIN